MLSLAVGLGALLFSDDAESAGRQISTDQTAAVPAITCPSNTAYALCEQASNITIPSPTSLSAQGKDFQKYADNPLWGNLKIEQEIQSYIFYTRTFSAIVSLSELQRLNI